MKLNDRVNAFHFLGESILEKPKTELQVKFWNVLDKAHLHNPWFTPDFCKNSIHSIANEWLNTKSLNQWIKSYPENHFVPNPPKRIGVVMAGNIPFVGFHDFLCVLIAGHSFVGKVSSKDGGIFQALIDILIDIEPDFAELITLTDGKLEDFDSIIATGSNNSARYFEYYFGKYPNIIRKNRHSIAILNGEETEEELNDLAKDIFTYFGLGCRNVSKILVPQHYNFEPLMRSFEPYKHFINHNKYANNYEYHRAIYLINQITHLDNGFVIVKPDESLGSPVGVIFYQHYVDLKSALDFISIHHDSLQCVVSNQSQIPNSINFGQTQQPKLNEYSDGIDTIEFLSSI